MKIPLTDSMFQLLQLKTNASGCARVRTQEHAARAAGRTFSGLASIASRSRTGSSRSASHVITARLMPTNLVRRIRLGDAIARSCECWSVLRTFSTVVGRRLLKVERTFGRQTTGRRLSSRWRRLAGTSALHGGYSYMQPIIEFIASKTDVTCSDRCPELRANSWQQSNYKSRPSNASRDRFSYSITSSARASSAGGTVRPSAFAVLRLITNSNLTEPATGKSAGLSP